MSVRDLLRGLIDARPDLTMAGLSREVAKNPAYLQQYIERGSPRTLPEDIRAHLASRLGVPAEQLREPSKINPQKITTASTSRKTVSAPKIPAISAVPDGLLKVLGMGQGGEDGWNPFNGDIVEYIAMPEYLRGVPGAYGVYVTGKSMLPRYEQGEKVHVHPGRPVQAGNYVLVQKKPIHEGEPPLAVIKRLAKETGTKYVLEQFNPPKTFDVLKSEVVSIHKIVGSSEA